MCAACLNFAWRLKHAGVTTYDALVKAGKMIEPENRNRNKYAADFFAKTPHCVTCRCNAKAR